jgi:GTP-binding protein Era
VSVQKNLFAAIVGRPNVGKSSLLNRLLGEKLAIVSDRPQTTRNRITGVLTKGEIQYVFIDTPGLHRPKSRLGEYMVRQAGGSVAGVDLVVLVTEWERGVSPVEEQLIENLRAAGRPAILVINKIDTLAKKDLMLQKIARMSALYDFAAIVPLSAATGDGIDALFGELEPFCAEGPHFFPDDALTDQPERAIVAEIIREKLLQNLRDEIPHGTAVAIERMQEREGAAMLDIDATIVCERESHKGIIIGKSGAALKRIATQARLDAEAFLGVKINLRCWVKVREGWRDNSTQLKNFGYREQ